jgi:Zn-dependent protease
VLLNEPSQTPYDLRFRLFGIPVRVHPFFWFAALLLGLGGSSRPELMMLWVGAVFVSIVVHEMGHALAAQAHGWPPSITLHGFGGLASYRPTYRSPRAQILITLAGPAAGFAFAVAILAVIQATGHHVRFERVISNFLPITWDFYDSGKLNLLIFDLLYVNIFWGLINLLPVYPLDGGQIARELLGLVNPTDAVRQSLWMSVITAGFVAVMALVKLDDKYIAIFFAYLAYTSYTTLQAYFGPGGGWGGFR